MVEAIKLRATVILEGLPRFKNDGFIHAGSFGNNILEKVVRERNGKNYIVAVWNSVGEKDERLLFADKSIKADRGIKDLLGLIPGDFKGNWFFFKIHEPESILKNNRVILELLEGRRLNGIKLSLFKSDIAKAAKLLGLYFEFIGSLIPAEPDLEEIPEMRELPRPALIFEKITRDNIYDLLITNNGTIKTYGSYCTELGFRFCKDKDSFPDLYCPFKFEIEVIPPGERNDTWYFILKPLRIFDEEIILKIARMLGEAIDADLNWEIKDIISRVPRNYENQPIIT